MTEKWYIIFSIKVASTYLFINCDKNIRASSGANGALTATLNWTIRNIAAIAKKTDFVAMSIFVCRVKLKGLSKVNVPRFR